MREEKGKKEIKTTEEKGKVEEGGRGGNGWRARFQKRAT